MENKTKVLIGTGLGAAGIGIATFLLTRKREPEEPKEEILKEEEEEIVIEGPDSVNVESDTDDDVLEFASEAEERPGEVCYNPETGETGIYKDGVCPIGWQKLPKNTSLDDLMGRWELHNDQEPGADLISTPLTTGELSRVQKHRSVRGLDEAMQSVPVEHKGTDDKPVILMTNIGKMSKSMGMRHRRPRYGRREITDRTGGEARSRQTWRWGPSHAMSRLKRK